MATSLIVITLINNIKANNNIINNINSQTALYPK